MNLAIYAIFGLIAAVVIGFLAISLSIALLAALPDRGSDYDSHE